MKRNVFAILTVLSLLLHRTVAASDLQADRIICGNLAAFHQLWEDSAFGEDPNGTERAAWILAAESGFEFLRWETSAARNSELWRGPVPQNIVAQVHTHPKHADPKPSVNDRYISQLVHVPIYVISKDGIWVGMPDGHTNRAAKADWYKKLAANCSHAR